jgi:hypothetical protein
MILKYFFKGTRFFKCFCYSLVANLSGYCVFIWHFLMAWGGRIRDQQLKFYFLFKYMRMTWGRTLLHVPSTQSLQFMVTQAKIESTCYIGLTMIQTSLKANPQFNTLDVCNSTCTATVRVWNNSSSSAVRYSIERRSIIYDWKWRFDDGKAGSVSVFRPW